MALEFPLVEKSTSPYEEDELWFGKTGVSLCGEPERINLRFADEEEGLWVLGISSVSLIRDVPLETDLVNFVASVAERTECVDSVKYEERGIWLLNTKCRLDPAELIILIYDNVYTGVMLQRLRDHFADS